MADRAAAVSPHAPGALFAPRPGEIAQAPGTRQLIVDKAFRSICLALALFTLGLVILIVARILVSAVPAMRQYGLSFLTGRVWDPNTDRYGILAETWGTLWTSTLALGLGTAFGLSTAIFLSEGYL